MNYELIYNIDTQ